MVSVQHDAVAADQLPPAVESVVGSETVVGSVHPHTLRAQWVSMAPTSQCHHNSSLSPRPGYCDWGPHRDRWSPELVNANLQQPSRLAHRRAEAPLGIYSNWKYNCMTDWRQSLRRGHCKNTSRLSCLRSRSRRHKAWSQVGTGGGGGAGR